jgi:hypothetical protein
MTAEQAVAGYYDAWRTRCGDMSGVSLADDFHFLGPVASFETADGFREMAGVIVRGELIYDAEALRRVMAAEGA